MRGSDKMKLVVGLGNPGKEYDNTRHNVGFSFIDFYLASKNIIPNWSKKFDGLVYSCTLNSEKVLFLKPQTFMNLSGNSVIKAMKYYDIDINDILVVSDDMDIILGNFKLKSAGSCGGHNGLRDIENKLSSSDYKRLKIGISKHNDIESKNYVLGKFSKDENSVLNDLFLKLCSVLDDYFLLPFSDLMSKYNRKNR